MIRNGLFLIALTVLVGCGGSTNEPSRGTQSSDGNLGAADEDLSATGQGDQLESAGNAYRLGDPERALAIVRQIMLVDPENTDALGLALNIHRDLRQTCEAAKIATQLSELERGSAGDYSIQAFHFNLSCGEYRAAERSLERLLNRNPDHVEAHRLIAQLLSAQGRRFSASDHVDQLIRAGVAQRHEILSLLERTGPFVLVDYGSLIDHDQTSLFLLGDARRLFAQRSKPAKVLALVRRVRAEFPDSTAAAAFEGRVLVESGDMDEVPNWLAGLPDGIDEQPEYWQAVGFWMTHQGRDREAVRALGESLQRDPTNRQSLRSLVSCLGSVGEGEQATRLRAKLADLEQIFRIARDADEKQAMWISGKLQELLRPWESTAWVMLAAQVAGNLRQAVPELNRRQAAILAWEQGTTAQQIQIARTERLLGFQTQEWPLPDLGAEVARRVASAEKDAQHIQMIEVAEQHGLISQFESGFPLDGGDYFPFQVNGGGLAALDYDLDGRCDLYVAQSGGKPNDSTDSQANQLFRCGTDLRFVEVGGVTGTDDRSYGQGVCAGDLNQDGFPDLLVANVGRNVVYLNQGDGTFVRSSEPLFDTDNWTSTLGLADLNGDRLPDIVEVNYIDDPRAYKKVCGKNYLECQPQEFRKGTDRVLLCQPEGGFAAWDSVCRKMNDSPKLGFGLIIANFDGRHGNDFFVANDGDFNHFWLSEQASGASEGVFNLVEAANLLGCSVGRRGDSQACMGVAAGDFNRDGTLDLHVTNFLDEPVNLFLQRLSGGFSDESVRFGLREPSMSVLGFGTQAADLDNDGWLDLSVVNGHVFDARHEGIRFRMPPQLFLGSEDGFSKYDDPNADEFWRTETIGRTITQLDFDADGRMDLVANHLDAPLALLKNESTAGNWLQLELVGTTSERDAIGAVAKVVVGDQQWSGWQIGGDGHMATNEPMIHFGVGSNERIDQITIVWPSGLSQAFDDLDANARYLLVEGEEEPLRR